MFWLHTSPWEVKSHMEWYTVLCIKLETRIFHPKSCQKSCHYLLKAKDFPQKMVYSVHNGYTSKREKLKKQSELCWSPFVLEDGWNSSRHALSKFLKQIVRNVIVPHNGGNQFRFGSWLPFLHFFFQKGPKIFHRVLGQDCFQAMPKTWCCWCAWIRSLFLLDELELSNLEK